MPICNVFQLYAFKKVSMMYNVSDILWVQYVVHVMSFNVSYCFISYYYCFFPYISCRYAYALQLISHTRCKLEAIKFVPSFYPCLRRLSIVFLLTILFLDCRVVIRNFALLSLSPKNRPFDRFAIAENLVCNDVDIFSKQIRTIELILRLQFLHWRCVWVMTLIT